MRDLTDRYVLANVVGCVLALASHVGARTGVLMPSIAVVFLGFPLTFLLLGATMATHPEARVTRAGPVVLAVRMDRGTSWRSSPLWCRAVAVALIANIVSIPLTNPIPAHHAPFAPFGPILFTAVFAHLLWSGVRTRLGALRVLRARGLSG